MIDQRIIPTPERIVRAAAHRPQNSLGVLVTQRPTVLTARRTGDVLDWWVDMSDVLAAGSDDHVTSVRASITPAGSPGDLEVSETAVVGSLVGLLIAGGVDGVTYTISVEVTTDTGRLVTVPLSQPVVGTGVSVGATSWAFSAPSGIRVRRSETLYIQLTAEDDDGNPLDITGMELAAQVRRPNGAKVADLSIVQSDEPSVAVIEAETDGWPIGTLQCDLRGVSLGVVVYSATFSIIVDRPVTQ